MNKLIRKGYTGFLTKLIRKPILAYMFKKQYPYSMMRVIGETKLPIHKRNMPFNVEQSRLASGNTYIPYTGPTHSISEIVDQNGIVNPYKVRSIMNEVVSGLQTQYGKTGIYPAQLRLENPAWHFNDPTTWDHSKLVTKRAFAVTQPSGYSKQDAVSASLLHDAGKLLSGDGHGPIGASLVSQVFPDASEDVIQAIYHHMEKPYDLTPFARYVKTMDTGFITPENVKEMPQEAIDTSIERAKKSGNQIGLQKLQELLKLRKSLIK